MQNDDDSLMRMKFRVKTYTLLLVVPRQALLGVLTFCLKQKAICDMDLKFPICVACTVQKICLDFYISVARLNQNLEF